ncbi:hypothetical protein KFL_003200110 [Klebsormidium nitens]|uniref:C2H2-type domain-containing protein n=1 Tax=Klebsormidium nitens TaxID=105231 RepID=A0A1Y1IBW8_KLENI|nr:hypothetical protein KFL_003200110 [Klebsormidium nitens]|eukprot:GAQ86919.1 hypothetical protein KFL_003200110 [Klebsormidium nitens]
MEVVGTERVFPHLDLRAFTHDELLLAAQLTAPGNTASWTWPPPPPPAAGFVLSASSLKQTCTQAADVASDGDANLVFDNDVPLPGAKRGRMSGGMADPLAMLADASLHVTTDEGGGLRRNMGSAADLLGESLLMLSQRVELAPPVKKTKTAPNTPALSQEERLIASLHNTLAKDRHHGGEASESLSDGWKPDAEVDFRKPKGGKPKAPPPVRGAPAPDMPKGWLMDIRYRGSGNRVDKLWTSPEGVQLRSIKECESFLLGKARRQPVTPVLKGKFGCPTCGLRFAAALDLGNHMAAHLEPAHKSASPKMKSEDVPGVALGVKERIEEGSVLRGAKSEDDEGGEGHVSGRTARWLQRVGLWKGPETGDTPRDVEECAESDEKASHLAWRNFEALLHDPASWYGLDLLSTPQACAVQRLICAHGRERACATLLQQRHRITADLINALYRPILSVLLFILDGTNDISEGKLGTLALKRRVCRALGLNRKGGDNFLSPETPSPPESPPLNALSEDDVSRPLKADVSKLPALMEAERPRRLHREAALALPAPEWGGAHEEGSPPPKEEWGFCSRKEEPVHIDAERAHHRDVNGAQPGDESAVDEKLSTWESDALGVPKCELDVVESPPPRVTRKRTRVDTIWPEALTAQLMSAHTQVPATIEAQVAALSPRQDQRGAAADWHSVRAQPPGKLRWLGPRAHAVWGGLPHSAERPIAERLASGSVLGAADQPLIDGDVRDFPSNSGGGEKPCGEHPSRREDERGGEAAAAELRARAAAQRNEAEELREMMERKLRLADSLEAQAAALETKCHVDGEGKERPDLRRAKSAGMCAAEEGKGRLDVGKGEPDVSGSGMAGLDDQMAGSDVWKVRADTGKAGADAEMAELAGLDAELASAKAVRTCPDGLGTQLEDGSRGKMDAFCLDSDTLWRDADATAGVSDAKAAPEGGSWVNGSVRKVMMAHVWSGWGSEGFSKKGSAGDFAGESANDEGMETEPCFEGAQEKRLRGFPSLGGVSDEKRDVRGLGANC